MEGGGCATTGRSDSPSFFALVLGAALAALGLRRRNDKR
jgi:MYXO-CTERM domain-containing protein